MSIFEDVERGAYEATVRGIRRAMAEMGFAGAAAPASQSPPLVGGHDSEHPYRSIREGIIAVLDAADGPLRPAEIAAAMGGKVNLLSIGSTLPKALRAKQIARVGVGLYVSVNAKPQPPEAPPPVEELTSVYKRRRGPTVMSVIVAVLDAAKEPMCAADIAKRVGSEVSVQSVKTTLATAVRQGLISKLAAGLYVAVGKVPGKTEPKRPPPLQGLALRVWQIIAAKPYSTKLEISAALEADGIELHYRKLAGTIGAMTRENYVKGNGQPHRFERFVVVEAERSSK